MLAYQRVTIEEVDLGGSIAFHSHEGTPVVLDGLEWKTTSEISDKIGYTPFRTAPLNHQKMIQP